MNVFSFGKKSTNRLETVCPDLSKLFREVIRWRDCSILCGVRSRAEQDRLFRLGRSRLRWPNGKHNVNGPDELAMAVDVAPYYADHEPHIVWPDVGDGLKLYAKQMGLYYNFAGYVQAQADAMGIKIRWGGDWDLDLDYADQTFDDLIHFELIER